MNNMLVDHELSIVIAVIESARRTAAAMSVVAGGGGRGSTASERPSPEKQPTPPASPDRATAAARVGALAWWTVASQWQRVSGCNAHSEMAQMHAERYNCTVPHSRSLVPCKQPMASAAPWRPYTTAGVVDAMRGRQGCHQVGDKCRNKRGGDTEQNEPRKQRADSSRKKHSNSTVSRGALTSHNSSAATMPCPYLVSPPTRPPVVAVLPPAAALLLPSSPLCTSAHSSPVRTRQLWWLVGQTLQKKRGWYALQKASQATGFLYHTVHAPELRLHGCQQQRKCHATCRGPAQCSLSRGGVPNDRSQRDRCS